MITRHTIPDWLRSKMPLSPRTKGFHDGRLYELEQAAKRRGGLEAAKFVHDHTPNMGLRFHYHGHGKAFETMEMEGVQEAMDFFGPRFDVYTVACSVSPCVVDTQHDGIPGNLKPVEWHGTFIFGAKRRDGSALDTPSYSIGTETVRR